MTQQAKLSQGKCSIHLFVIYFKNLCMYNKGDYMKKLNSITIIGLMLIFSACSTTKEGQRWETRDRVNSSKMQAHELNGRNKTVKNYLYIPVVWGTF
jgi:hypothetical protein